MKKRRGTGFVFDNKSDDLEKQRKQLLQKFNEISEKTTEVVVEEEEEETTETTTQIVQNGTKQQQQQKQQTPESTDTTKNS